MSEGSAAHPGAERLADFGLGKLEDAEAREVWRHVEGCEDCRRQVEGQTPDSFLRELRQVGFDPASAQTVEPPPSPFPIEMTEPYQAAPFSVPAELAKSAKYRILEKLGQGGMGAVYKAEQVGLNRIVAIKVMNSAIIDNPEAVRSFRQEVKAAGQLQHPTIVTAFDADQVGDVYFLVMEYVPGCSLDHLVKQGGALPVREACRVVTQAALGLQHAHERGMVHRDIKPLNLMVTDKGVVKILDFGLAQLPQESRSRCGGTAVDSFLGTPEYVAPEQANDASSVDIRTDIYSLGCTLYYLLAGRPPFQRATPLNTIFAHVHEEARPLAGVPEVLGAIVARMMAKKREHRYATPRDVAMALESFLAREQDEVEQDLDATATPAVAVERAVRGSRGRFRAVRYLVAAATLASLFVVCGMVFFYIATKSTPEYPVLSEVEEFATPRLAEDRPGVLVQHDAQRDAWSVVRPGDKVPAGRTLTCLPGYESQLTFASGVKLNLLGGLAEFGDHVSECALRIHAPPAGFAADLELDRGRVEVSSAEGGPTRVVRFRFLRETWNLHLAAGSRVRAELTQEPPEKPGADRGVTLLVQGQVAIEAGEKLRDFPSLSRLDWRTSRPDGFVAEKLPEWPRRDAGATAEAREMQRWLQEWARDRFPRDGDLTSPILAALRDRERPGRERLLALAFLAALDDPSLLVEFLDSTDPDSAAIRDRAKQGLRDWLRRNPDSKGSLVDTLLSPQERRSAIQRWRKVIPAGTFPARR